MALLLALAPTGYAAEAAGVHDHAAMGTAKPAAWTAYPMLTSRMRGERRESMEISLLPQNIVAAAVTDFSNDLDEQHARRQLPIGMGGARFDRDASGGFHLLTAREERADQVLLASTVYYNGERGAKDPEAMFMQNKHELEIIPQPYPREHSRYRANEGWKFLVRFNGQALASQKVVLQTSNGSRTELLTDASGVLSLQVPDDFAARQQGGETSKYGGRRAAEFVLATAHSAAGKNYLSAFNSTYGPDAFDQRSLAMGLGFTLLGMLGAVPLLWQRKRPKSTGLSADKKAQV